MPNMDLDLWISKVKEGHSYGLLQVVAITLYFLLSVDFYAFLLPFLGKDIYECVSIGEELRGTGRCCKTGNQIGYQQLQIHTFSSRYPNQEFSSNRTGHLSYLPSTMILAKMVAAQQGQYLAECFNKMQLCEENPEGPLRFRDTDRHHFKPFRCKHLGQFAPLGILYYKRVCFFISVVVVALIWEIVIWLSIYVFFGGIHQYGCCTLQEAVKLKPTFSDAYLNLGNVYKSLGMAPEAIVCYHCALQSKPDYVMAFAWQGFMLGFMPKKLR